MFNENKYKNYIENKENIAEIKIALAIVLCVALGIIINRTLLKKDTIIIGVISAIIGLILGYINYRKTRIKTEEMKMKLDLYQKIMNM